MARFFDTFDVIEGDGQWASGPYPIDTLACGFTVGIYDICEPASPAPLEDTPMGRDVFPFAVKAYQEVPTRCAPNYVDEYVTAAMEASTEYTVTNALWNGPEGITDDNSMFLTHSGITEVPRAGDLYTTLANVLIKAHQQAPHIRPVVHLGYQSAMALQFGLNNLAQPYVVAPGYPADAVAVTGPVRVRLGSVETTSQVDPRNNRKQVEATRLAAIEFDPCLAVRAADSA